MFESRRRLSGVYAILVGAACVVPHAAGQAIIIDHTCTDLGRVPLSWVTQAKTQFFASYGHTSHGSQIVSGMNNLNEVLGCACGGCGDAGCIDCDYGFCDDYAHYKYGGSHPQAPAGVLSLWDGEPEGAHDLGNPNRTAWATATRTMLDDPRYASRNLVIWSWCGQVDGSEADIQLYLDLMTGLRQDYPDVTFVYMTGHLNGTGATGNVHQRNNQIRQHVLATGGVLFDFADIESYDPAGNCFLDLEADDQCYYWVEGTRHNWADEWCAAHPGDPLCDSCSCAHSRPLNCNLKARAFWWMMARLAGWPGPSPSVCRGDANCDGQINWRDIDYFVAAQNDNVSGWEALFAPAAPSCPFTSNDLNEDGTVNWRDIDPFVAVQNTTCP